MKKIMKMIKEEADLVSETSFSFMNYFKNFKIVSTKMLVLFLFLVLNANGHGLGPNSPQMLDTFSGTKISYDMSKTSHVISIRNRTQSELVKEVKAYMFKVAPSNKLTASTIVEVCDEYDLDLIFVLSQGLLESHYGTKGIAAKTNSIFNVGTYDDGQILYRYKHPDESIKPYAELLTRRYLVGKDISKLLKDKGYTNDKGYRFASSKKYEQCLRTLMVQIDLDTSIGMLQSILNMDDETLMAFFGPEESLSNFDELYASK